MGFQPDLDGILTGSQWDLNRTLAILKGSQQDSKRISMDKMPMGSEQDLTRILTGSQREHVSGDPLDLDRISTGSCPRRPPKDPGVRGAPPGAPRSAKDLPRPSTGTPNWISTGSQWELVFNRISMRSGQDPNGILTGSQLDLNKISMGS